MNPDGTGTASLTSHALNPAWSADSKWIAYSINNQALIQRVWVYSVEKGEALPVTDGLSDASEPVFDRSGKYLFFTASTDQGPSNGFLNLSMINRPVSRSAYVMVLRKDLPSPLAPMRLY